MGKPKKGKKGRGEEEFDDDVDIIDPIAAAEQEEKDDKPASAAGKKGKKGRKKKDDDWEDDVAAELAALSMEANKGMKEEEKEEEILPVKKEKKKTRGKKKAADSDEEEDAPSGGPAPVSAFQMLDIEEPEQDDDDDDDDNETPEKKENNKTNETEKASNKQKKSKKEKRKQKQADEEDDLDAILAELEKPVEKPAKSKKDKTKQAETSENQTEPVKSEQTDNDAQKISDDLPEGKKEENISKSKDVEDAMEGDEENEEEGHTVKTAAQKKKEKRERQKKQREMEKMQAAKKGKKEASPEVVEEKKEEAAAKPEMEAAAEEGADRESDEEEGDKKSKKDKKKKKDKDAKDAKGKKKPASAQLKAMQEALAKLKEEEERLKREEEEKERKREEALRLREEQKRLEEERKQKKKQKEKERKERLKQEGKLLTAKQKQDRQRAMQLLETMKAQGIEVPEKTEKQKPRYMSLKDKRKKQQQQQEESTSEREKTPDEGATPPTTPETPSDLSEKFPPSAPKEEKEEEDLKDAWDISSEEEEEEETKPAAPASKPVVKEEVKEEEEEESEEDDETDTTESEDEESSEDEDLDASEKAYARIQKRHEDAEAKRSTDHLRAPVVCVLGHVDTGKTKILDKLRRTNVQDGEAGGITQQIGATNVPGDAIKEATKMCKEFSKQEFKIPGLLIIDTPGHESFSNLRTRGSSLCDIAILVVDIMHGLEPQTLESIQLLRDRKTPFVVALNKIDRLFQWKSNPHSDVVNTLKKQNLNTKDEFDERVKEVILQFAEQSLNACLFYDNKNPREYVSLVPTSAHSGDGMGNLLALICELTQTMLAKRLAYSEELQATVMEVKAIQGLGTTMDVILVNGKLHEGETIVVPGTEGPIVTQIRGLLMPQPMKELRVKNAYEKTKVLKAAQGVKIIAKDLEKALAGLPMYAPQHQDEVEYYKEELSRALKDALNSIKLSERGVFVQASTLGSLEALLEFLRTSKIPYAGINIGPVHKKDIMRASVMLDHDPQWAVILAFDVKVEREAQELADSVGVQIFTADIIYHLFDQFMAHREELKKRKQEEYKHIAVFPCKIRVLPQYIFNSRDPIVCGVSIEAGFLREGTPLCVPSKEFVELGRVTSLEINHKPVDIARKGQEVCIKIEPTGGDAPKMYGRHFDHDDMLVSKISRESIDAVKNYFRDFMTKTDWQLVMELKKVFDIL